MWPQIRPVLVLSQSQPTGRWRLGSKVFIFTPSLHGEELADGKTDQQHRQNDVQPEFSDPPGQHKQAQNRRNHHGKGMFAPTLKLAAEGGGEAEAEADGEISEIAPPFIQGQQGMQPFAAPAGEHPGVGAHQREPGIPDE